MYFSLLRRASIYKSWITSLVSAERHCRSCSWLYARGADHHPRKMVTIPRVELGGIAPATQSDDWRQRFDSLQASSGKSWIALSCIHSKLAHDCRRSIGLLQWCPTGFVILTFKTLTRKQAELRHAHQGLDRTSSVVAVVYYSPWVMPGRSIFQCTRNDRRSRRHAIEFDKIVRSAILTDSNEASETYCVPNFSAVKFLPLFVASLQ